MDVLVIGGGITGCGVARDAALRGLRVALVEADDFASGTSSRSSRLIHGGLRYLEHGHLHLVFEASGERRRLLALAPHLVRPLEFLWPIYRGARVGRWKLAAGLTLYDVLSLFRNVGGHQPLNRAGVLAREPNLRADDLAGGERYFDASTNDARLTLANALGAEAAGAIVVNHASVEALVRRDGRIAGAMIRDRRDDLQLTVRARVVVNAAGPWTDRVAALPDAGASPVSTRPAASADHVSTRPAGPAERPTVRGSKGVHIAVPRERIGNHGALTLLSPSDGRVMFVLPGDRLTIVGTTDTFTSARPDGVRATAADVSYLLNAANAFFPRAALTRDDVVSAWAGIRPLIAGSGTDATAADPGSASREHAVQVRGDGLVSITGGKLTTYRVMADDVMRDVLDLLGAPTAPSPTRDAPLPGGDVPDIDAEIRAAAAHVGEPTHGRHLVRAFGSRWRDVAREIERPGGSVLVEAGMPFTVGEMRYCVRHELALTLSDLLIRRTPLAFETRDHGVAAAERLAPALAPLLEWSPAGIARAVAEYRVDAERLFAIDD